MSALARQNPLMYSCQPWPETKLCGIGASARLYNDTKDPAIVVIDSRLWLDGYSLANVGRADDYRTAQGASIQGGKGVV